MSRTAVAALLLAALALSGCGKEWTHPDIASPREEDQRFETDSATCRDESARAPEADRRRVFEDCLTLLGWEKKD
ncbi:hypothetical protein [Desulfovibrio aminophilus]|uniref:hypothetical protein n=1 Tax=Desulfovibrio aminophilus TaxID=81425 RepID=UPI0033935CD4